VAGAAEVGMDAWGCEQLWPWLAVRVALAVGPLMCIVPHGPRLSRAQR
jgi:hypothetical protein